MFGLARIENLEERGGLAVRSGVGADHVPTVTDFSQKVFAL